MRGRLWTLWAAARHEARFHSAWLAVEMDAWKASTRAYQIVFERRNLFFCWTHDGSWIRREDYSHYGALLSTRPASGVWCVARGTGGSGQRIVLTGGGEPTSRVSYARLCRMFVSMICHNVSAIVFVNGRISVRAAFNGWTIHSSESSSAKSRFGLLTLTALKQWPIGRNDFTQRAALTTITSAVVRFGAI